MVPALCDHFKKHHEAGKASVEERIEEHVARTKSEIEVPSESACLTEDLVAGGLDRRRDGDAQGPQAQARRNANPGAPRKAQHQPVSQQ